MDEWHPIETGPKDGTFVLIVCHVPGNQCYPPRDETFTYVTMGYWWGDALNEPKWMDGSVGAWNPTHWVPIPKPPEGYIFDAEVKP
jgi:uncharacterized protein DUF551